MIKTFKIIAFTSLGLIGVGLVAAGATLIYLPLGLIVAGAFLITVAVLADY